MHIFKYKSKNLNKIQSTSNMYLVVRLLVYFFLGCLVIQLVVLYKYNN